jgi:outer membrane beta-barrel protein
MTRIILALSTALLAVQVVWAPGAARAAEGAHASDSTAAEPSGPHVLTEKKVRLSGDKNNVARSGPGSAYAIVGVYPKGAEFVVIAKSGSWYNVRLSPTDTGWIHASLCEEFDDMSDLEFRPNPRLFSRVGSFALTAYAGGYAFDRKSNSLVLGARLGYHVFEFIEIEGGLGWTHVVRPAEIVESLFELSLEDEEFHMLFYSMNANVELLPGRQMVPFLNVGLGSSIMRGETATSFNYGVGISCFVRKDLAVRFEFRSYHFDSDASDGHRNTNFEFVAGNSFYF